MAAFSLSMGHAQAQGATNASEQDQTVQGGLEIVVVTAQRREQTLQDVPLSISAVTAQSAEARGIVDTETLQQAVPGLTFTKGAAYALPVIRGIGTNTVSQGNENSVAVYVDGIIQITPSASVFSFNNIERVEVLKGPQGTLFGRNANGGVINVITRVPSMAPSLEIEVGAGNFETYEGNLYGTAGVGANLATDLAVYVREQNKGWGTNLFDGSEVFRGYEAAARNKWRWTPSDRTEVVISGSVSTSKDDGTSLHPAPGDLGADGVTTYQGMYNVNMDNTLIGGRSFARRKGWDLGAHITHDLGWGTLVSITGYSEVDVDRPNDSDWTPLPLLHAFVDQYDDGFTQELQLQSAESSPIEWIAGLYYLDTTSEFRKPRGIQIMGEAAGGLDFVRILATQDSKSYAAFAQASAEVLPRTRLTLGGRYTEDERDVTGYTELPTGPLPSISQSADFSKFTWRVALDYAFTDDVMGYISQSTGFKAGLFNMTNVAGDAVKPESVDATEVGIKTMLLDRRLQFNASAFYYDYEDIQAEVVRSDAGGVLQLINAATARVRGVDMDLVVAAADNLTLQAGVSYLDAKYRSFPDAVDYVPNPAGGRLEVGGDASGNRMIKAPEWQWNLGGIYEVMLGSGQVTMAANYSYQSKYYWDFGNDFVEPSRNMLSATLAWAPDETWEVSFWGRNLLEEKITSFGLPSVWGFQQSPGAPRTYGVTIKAAF